MTAIKRSLPILWPYMAFLLSISVCRFGSICILFAYWKVIYLLCIWDGMCNNCIHVRMYFTVYKWTCTLMNVLGWLQLWNLLPFCKFLGSRCIYDGPCLKCSLEDLAPGTQYSIRLGTVSEFDASPLSDPTDIVTNETGRCYFFRVMRSARSEMFYYSEFCMCYEFPCTWPWRTKCITA